MRTVRLGYLGFGTVGRALHALLERRRDALRHDYDVEVLVTGVATRRGGWCACGSGLDPTTPDGAPCEDVRAWLVAAKPDVVFEMIALDPHRGQPAIDYLRASLEAGAHAISANKGPVVHGYHELAALAGTVGRRYLFESAVMDGAPVFSLARHGLPLAGLRAVRGVFTSTATIVLEAIERGGSHGQGIAHAQHLGIAEADPSYDVDGWDSVVKLCALANVVFGGRLQPQEVERQGIGDLDDRMVRRAAAEGRPYRLVGRVALDEQGHVSARVAPEPLAPDDPLRVACGTSLVMHYEAEVFPGGLTVTSHDPDPTTTAFGLLTDFLSTLASQSGSSGTPPRAAE